MRPRKTNCPPELWQTSNVQSHVIQPAFATLSSIVHLCFSWTAKDQYWFWFPHEAFLTFHFIIHIYFLVTHPFSASVIMSHVTMNLQKKVARLQHDRKEQHYHQKDVNITKSILNYRILKLFNNRCDSLRPRDQHNLVLSSSMRDCRFLSPNKVWDAKYTLLLDRSFTLPTYFSIQFRSQIIRKIEPNTSSITNIRT